MTDSKEVERAIWRSFQDNMLQILPGLVTEKDDLETQDCIKDLLLLPWQEIDRTTLMDSLSCFSFLDPRKLAAILPAYLIAFVMDAASNGDDWPDIGDRICAALRWDAFGHEISSFYDEDQRRAVTMSLRLGSELTWPLLGAAAAMNNVADQWEIGW